MGAKTLLPRVYHNVEGVEFRAGGVVTLSKSSIAHSVAKTTYQFKTNRQLEPSALIRKATYSKSVKMAWIVV